MLIGGNKNNLCWSTLRSCEAPFLLKSVRRNAESMGENEKARKQYLMHIDRSGKNGKVKRDSVKLYM